MEAVGTYWVLTMKDGETFKVRPDYVAEVKRQMREERHVITKDWTRSVSDIKSFDSTSEPVRELKALSSGNLLEEAARAFKEPLYNEDGSIVVKWVSKPVTKREYNTHYSKLPGYRFVKESGGMIIVAFRMAVHEIDESRLTPLTDYEIAKMT